ncbi:MAG TPA: DNA polymerase I [Alphaproteobacteria bacterium]|nr:DNA polymerase I [Alphaproteobacteria bacterium]
MLKEYLLSLGFKSIAAKLGAPDAPAPQKAERKNIDFDTKFITINNLYQLESFVNNLPPNLTLNIFTLYNNSEAEKIAVYSEERSAIIKPAESKVVDDNQQNDLFSTPQIKQSLNYAYPVLQKLLDIKSNKYVFESSKDFLTATKLYSHLTLPASRREILNNFDDIELMNYLLHGTSKENNIYFLAKNLLEYELKDLAEPANQTDENLLKYAALQHKIHQKFQQEIFEKKLLNIYEHFEKPLIQVLIAMENAGIKVDANILKTLSADFTGRLKTLEKEIYKLADGEEFNIASPKQLGEVLFERIGIQGGKKSKSGQYITDSEVLETLAVQGYEIADKVLEYRGLAKLINTYTEALQKEINPKTHRVHTKFNNVTTTTGRLSSVAPNLQNIPIRSEDGRKIRKAFIAEAGNKLIGADYSQIELRLLAHVANIDVLIKAFKEGKDIHSATAAQIFGVDITQVTREQRDRAKTVNFGIIYGQSAFGLAKQLGISNGEAKTIIEKYFAQYPGIRAYMDNTIKFARENGYVETIFKRKIYVHGINDKNGARRNFAERAAINAPLQGSAADIIKLAMIAISSELSVLSSKYSNNSELRTKNLQLLLQIHDELILECSEDAAESVAAKCKNIMENVTNLSVPLVVETRIGNNWGEVH